MNILSKLSIACTIILCIASCKKKDEDNNNTPAGSDCLMYSVIHHYNECKDSTVIVGSLLDKKMSGIMKFSNCPGGVPGQLTISGRKFIYQGNKVYVVDSPAVADYDTLIVDAGSLRILEVHRGNSMVTGPIATRYEYAADGTLLRGITSFDSVPYDTALYTFSNGDMIMQVNTQMGHPDTVRYTYYTDKAVPANGYITQNGLRYGNAFTYKNTHLQKGYADGQGNLLYQYAYEEDSYGNIKRVIRTSTGSSAQSDTTTYRYACGVEQL